VNKLDILNIVNSRRASYAPFGSTTHTVTKNGDRIVIDRFSPINGKKTKKHDHPLTKPTSPVSFEHAFKNIARSAMQESNWDKSPDIIYSNRNQED